jgi:hypothetical protein
MFRPSLGQYGGKPVDGLVVVTATGMVSKAIGTTDYFIVM